MYSPEGAAQLSPGRKPWVSCSISFEPRRGGTECRPFGAGLPRYPAVSLNCHLRGFTKNPLRGDTDVTRCFADVHRAEPDLRHGSCGVGESFPARTARRIVRANCTTTIQTHAAVFLGRRPDAQRGVGGGADGLCGVPKATPHAQGFGPGCLRQARWHGTW